MPPAERWDSACSQVEGSRALLRGCSPVKHSGALQLLLPTLALGESPMLGGHTLPSCKWGAVQLTRTGRWVPVLGDVCCRNRPGVEFVA